MAAYTPVWATAETDPDALRERLRAIVAEAEPNAEVVLQDHVATAFLVALFGLGRVEAATREFLQETGARLADFDLGVHAFLQESVSQLLQEFRFEDQWARACERRSAVQFLLDLYAGHAPRAVLEALETDEVDGLLRDRGDLEGYFDEEDRPSGVPASHWWWTL